jgi:hypothetical protein
VYLGGAATRDVLAAACRKLADSLARELKDNGLAYREAVLEAETEEGFVRETICFARPVPYSTLPLHAGHLLARLKPTAPVEALVLVVDGVAAVREQTTIFDLDRRTRQARLERALSALAGKYPVVLASALEADQREKMLAFYDPFRWGPRRHGPQS